MIALDDLTFTVPAGEVVGFLGPNGSGKTTAMRAIFGLVALDSGTVQWNAVLTEQAAQGRGVLFSSHQLDLVEDLCTSVAIIDHGRLVARGAVDDLATQGSRRLVVKVDGDHAGAWASDLPGAQVLRVDGGAVRLILDEDTDAQAVLATAMRAGPVLHFAFERRRLSEVFRESLAVSGF